MNARELLTNQIQCCQGTRRSIVLIRMKRSFHRLRNHAVNDRIARRANGDRRPKALASDSKPLASRVGKRDGAGSEVADHREIVPQD